MYLNDDSYAQTQQLQLSSKVDMKQDQEADQIAYLNQKIGKMQKNYISMQKLYSQKIKYLYGQIKDKDEEFRGLQQQLLQIRSIATQHKNKVEQLYKTASKKHTDPKVKSKSPAIALRPNNRASTNNVQTERSPSPKNQSKKTSQPHKSSKNIKRTLVLTKNSVETIQSANIKKNTSEQKFPKKSSSPQNSNEKLKKLTKNQCVQSLKFQKKVSTGMNSFKQKQPIFK